MFSEELRKKAEELVKNTNEELNKRDGLSVANVKEINSFCSAITELVKKRRGDFK